MSTISIFGRMDEIMVASVKEASRTIPKDSIVRVRINSLGGNMEALRKISGFLYFLQKYKKCKIYGELIHGESAALKLFLNTKKRFVLKESIGVIHLPVANSKNKTSEIAAQKKVASAIRFIERRTKMSREKIIQSENFYLSAKEMVNLGIAHEIVQSFPAEPI